jgi:hypothetical protein
MLFIRTGNMVISSSVHGLPTADASPIPNRNTSQLRLYTPNQNLLTTVAQQHDFKFLIATFKISISRMDV